MPRAYSNKGLAVFSASLAIVLFFALHPAVNAYHTGFAGYFVSAIFITAAVTAAYVSRIYVLAALIFLAFVEPEVAITNSLDFNIVSNGLLIGAGTAWLWDRPRIVGSSFPILAAIGGMAAMTVVFPVIVGSIGWIHIHDALMIGKYGLIAVLAFSLNTEKFWWVAVALAAGSLVVAAVSIAQAFHMPWFDPWMFETYFASRNIAPDEIIRLSENYSRAYGVAGPIGTALLLVMSLGAWIVMVVRSDTTSRIMISSLGMSVVLAALYLTGSRLGIVIAVPILALGLVWWRGAGGQRRQALGFSAAAVFVLIMMLGSTALNDSFRQTTATSTARFVTTIPNLLRGTPDPSFAARLQEFSGVDLRYLDITAERDTAINSEYLVLLKRHGLAGFLLMWQIWLMITVRAAKAATRSDSVAGRNAGMIALAGVLALVVGAIGSNAFFDPTRMTVLLILVGMTPALGPYSVSFRVWRNAERVREIAT